MRKFFTLLLFILFLSSGILRAEVSNINYAISLKVLGVPIKIGEITSVFEVSSEKYSLEYNLKSENLVELISPIDGVGKIYGKYTKSKLIPESYNYTYQRKEKRKSTKIEFSKSNVINIEVDPPFEKSKLTPVAEEMLLDVIDPSTGIIIMGDYQLNKNCNVDYRIFDGKRRYDLKYTNIVENTSYKICTLKQYRLGGFKNDESDTGDPFVSAQQIDTYFMKLDNEYIIDKFITKNGLTELIIDVTIQ